VRATRARSPPATETELSSKNGERRLRRHRQGPSPNQDDQELTCPQALSHENQASLGSSDHPQAVASGSGCPTEDQAKGRPEHHEKRRRIVCRSKVGEFARSTTSKA